MSYTLLKTQIQSVLTSKFLWKSLTLVAEISAILITCVPKTGEEGAGDLILLVHTRAHTSTHVLCVGYTYTCVC